MTRNNNRGNGVDTCKSCGSTALWGSTFDRNGLHDENGTWDLLCEDCGRLQNRSA